MTTYKDWISEADKLAPYIQEIESGGNPRAISPKGARGLMQVMPDTARDPGYGIRPARDNSPEENKRLGRDYLAALLNKYNGNINLTAAAYNAGPGTVDRAGGVPRIKETQDYVAKLGSMINPISSARADDREDILKAAMAADKAGDEKAAKRLTEYYRDTYGFEEKPNENKRFDFRQSHT
jgi:soluble lytic murein transglycosylase